MRFLIWNFYATILKTHCICNDKMHQRCSTVVESSPSSDENASIELFQFSFRRSAAAAEVTQDSQFSHLHFPSSWKSGCCRRTSSSSSHITLNHRSYTLFRLCMHSSPKNTTTRWRKDEPFTLWAKEQSWTRQSFSFVLKTKRKVFQPPDLHN